MEKIKVKPVSNDFWVLQKDNKKVGQVVHTPAGYMVNINGVNVNTYPSLKTFKADKMFEFTEIKKSEPVPAYDVHGYPTNEVAFNAVWNLQYKLPLFTYTSDSKSWYAAGFYKVKIKNQETIEFCPKLITLQRNKFEGPFAVEPILIFDQFLEFK